jgi:hypothetical protein
MFDFCQNTHFFLFFLTIGRNYHFLIILKETTIIPDQLDYPDISNFLMETF